MSLKLGWGLQPPPTATVAWGARAIYKLKNRTTEIDLLGDRQHMVGGDEKEREALARFLKTKAIKALQKRCLEQYLPGDSEQVICFALDGYIIEASPRASYGYLYICVSKA